MGRLVAMDFTIAAPIEHFLTPIVPRHWSVVKMPGAGFQVRAGEFADGSAIG